MDVGAEGRGGLRHGGGGLLNAERHVLVSPAVEEFRALAARLYGYRTVDDREIVISPYEGNYGHAAGLVICVEGSPPKGTFIVHGIGWAVPRVAYVGASSRIRALQEKARDAVLAFLDEALPAWREGGLMQAHEVRLRVPGVPR